MAFSLNGVMLANPVQVISDTEPVSARNLAYGGVVNYDHTTLDARRFIHTVQVQWAGLSAAELSAIRGAWQQANEDYVELIMDGLSVISQGSLSDDDLFVIVLEDTGLDVAFEQGWDKNGNGPIIYGATATFVSEPQVDS